MRALLTAALLCLVLTACGLKGPLYLPDGSAPQGTVLVPAKVQK